MTIPKVIPAAMAVLILVGCKDDVRTHGSSQTTYDAPAASQSVLATVAGRLDYHVDNSNYEEWYLSGMKCSQISMIRVHTSPQFAPYIDFHCSKASGNQRIGVAPNQWVQVKLSNGTWSLLRDVDRR